MYNPEDTIVITVGTGFFEIRNPRTGEVFD